MIPINQPFELDPLNFLDSKVLPLVIYNEHQDYLDYKFDN